MQAPVATARQRNPWRGGLVVLGFLGLLAGCTTVRPLDDGDDTATTDDSGILDTADTSDTAGDPWAPYGLLSLNLHCLKTDGTTYGTNAARFAAIAQAAADEDVAVLAVQEACERTGESAMDLLEAALEAETSTAWTSTWAAAHLAWEGTADEALEGVGILVRGTLTEASSRTYVDQTSLLRVEASATVPASLGGFRVHSVHLSVLDGDTRALQAREAAAGALVSAHPSLDVLVAGDLNAMPGTAAHGAFGQMGFDDLSSPLDSNRIDHVFAHRGAAVEARSVGLIFDGGDHPVVSDHPGVLVRLGFAEAPAVVTTRIDVHADVGWGHHVTLRGDTLPLSWDGGWPATALGSDLWRLVLTELPTGSFAYKVLVDDVSWQQGENETGSGGADNDVTPTF